MAIELVSSKVTTILLIFVPIILFILLGRGKSIIPGAGGTANCNAATRFCTCPSGESFQFGANSDCTDCTIECANRGTAEAAGPFSSRFDPVSGAISPTPFENNLIQGTLQFPLADKISIPIIEPSIDFEDPRLFDEFAHGACQCDDYICCYKAPYQPSRGDVRTEKECVGIQYGDKVKACNNAFEDFQQEVFEAGIDRNSYINHKVDDSKFFFEMRGDRHGRNRHTESRARANVYMAYANSGGMPARTKVFKAVPAFVDENDILTRKTHAIHRLLGESGASRRLRDNRLRRRLLGY